MSRIRILQTRIAALLLADPEAWFGDDQGRAPVLKDHTAENGGEVIDNLIDASLAKLGLAVTVALPTATLVRKRHWKYQVRIFLEENELFNRDAAAGGTGRSADEFAERIAELLDGKGNGLTANPRGSTLGLLIPGDPTISDQPNPAGDNLLLQVLFTTEFSA